mgnify:CR=1 FL=1
MSVAYVCKDENGQVTAVFSNPQSEPLPEGYQVISDEDGSLQDFKVKMERLNAPPPVPEEPTLEELQKQLETIQGQIAKMMTKGKKK